MNETREDVRARLARPSETGDNSEVVGERGGGAEGPPRSIEVGDGRRRVP